MWRRAAPQFEAENLFANQPRNLKVLSYLVKPLAWQGDLCFGPSRGNRVTFQLPQTASSRWKGVPDPDEAALSVIVAYFGAYGPATITNFRSWLTRGRVSARQIRKWFDAVGDRLTEVRVDGHRVHILAEHVDELAATRPTDAVRLLPGFDRAWQRARHHVKQALDNLDCLADSDAKSVLRILAQYVVRRAS